MGVAEDEELDGELEEEGLLMGDPFKSPIANDS